MILRKKNWILLIFSLVLFACSKAPDSTPSENSKSEALVSAEASNKSANTDAAEVSADTDSSEEKPKSSPYVTVEGTRFFLNGKPYYFAGTNFWFGTYLGAPESAGGNRERLIQELDMLKDMGITNLRVLAASESGLSRSLKPTIQPSPGEYNEDLLIGLDFMLAEMAKRDMKGVLFLNNFWQWSGGMTSYVSWVRGKEVADPDLTGDWNTYQDEAASFYDNPETKVLFEKLIRKIVTRTNTITGTPYVEEKAIMAWELANEPRAGSFLGGQENFARYKNWIESTAKFIHELDKNHLVTTGAEGAAGTSGKIELFAESHKTPYIDYLTIHMWPKNWGWLDQKDVEGTYDDALLKAKTYINDHLKVAVDMNKPAVLEEFGVERDLEDYRVKSTTKVRDRFFKDIFAFVYERAKAGEPIVGTNFWTWAGQARSYRDDFVWRPGDELMGDPPQEPQGLNSVFDVDLGTLEVLRLHGTQMESLSK